MTAMRRAWARGMSLLAIAVAATVACSAPAPPPAAEPATPAPPATTIATELPSQPDIATESTPHDVPTTTQTHDAPQAAPMPAPASPPTPMTQTPPAPEDTLRATRDDHHLDALARQGRSAGNPRGLKRSARCSKARGGQRPADPTHRHRRRNPPLRRIPQRARRQRPRWTRSARSRATSSCSNVIDVRLPHQQGQDAMNHPLLALRSNARCSRSRLRSRCQRVPQARGGTAPLRLQPRPRRRRAATAATVAEPVDLDFKPATGAVERRPTRPSRPRKNRIKASAKAAREKWRGKTFEEFEALGVQGAGRKSASTSSTATSPLPTGSNCGNSSTRCSSRTTASRTAS